jgi:Domain of unknown function (DUF2382)
VYLEEEKITKPEGQNEIKRSKVENSGPTKPPNGAVETKRQTSEENIVPPELPRATLAIIRPTRIQNEESLAGKAADLMDSLKDKTEEAIDSIKSATGQGVSRTISNLDSGPLVIPIIEQKSSSETKTYTEEITIEKKKVERKKNIEVKVAYDEIFVNGKEIGSSMGEAFREIKDKIIEIVSFDHDRDEKQLEKIKRDMIPLLENSSETEKIISLYAEQIVVSKRTVKIGDLIIRKRKVTDKHKVGIDQITEQLTVQNPTGGASTQNDE